MGKEIKENYYRKVIIENISEEEIGVLSPAHDWKYAGTKSISGVKYHVFANENMGQMIYFTYKNAFVSTNVLPIDCANINKKEYLLGGDSAEEQANCITEDILYDFCIKINLKAEDENVKNDKNIWCSIIPSAHDIKQYLKRIK